MDSDFVRRHPSLTGYLVQRDGVVIGPTGRVLTPYEDKDGYLRYTIRRRHYAAHRLVYETFVGEIPAGLVCCHQDGNPKNNTLPNLRVDTQKQNIRDKKAHGTHQIGDAHPRCKYPESLVAKLREFLARTKGAHGRMALAARTFDAPYHFVFDVEHGRRLP